MASKHPSTSYGEPAVEPEPNVAAKEEAIRILAIGDFKKRLEEMIQNARVIEVPEDRSEELMAQTEALWHAAPDWDCLVLARRSFIEGKIHYWPSQYAPLCPQSADLVDDFHFMHDHGLIISSSQPRERPVPFRSGDRWEVWRQRPFLEFLLPTKHPNVTEDQVNKFLQVLYTSSRDDSPVPIVYAVEYYYKADKTHRGKNIIPFMQTKVFVVLGKEDYWHVTQMKRADTEEQLESAE